MSRSQGERLILLVLLLIVALFFGFGALAFPPVDKAVWIVVMLVVCAAALWLAVVERG